MVWQQARYPPEDLATLGSLIVVDKKCLRPFERIRTAAKRTLENRGVGVGLGTVVMSTDYAALKADLNLLQSEFYAEKQKLIDTFDGMLVGRLTAHPDYAKLIKQYAPSTRYVENRLSFEIDTIKLDAGANDANARDLSDTLSRDSNNVRIRLIEEIASFIDDTLEGSIEKEQRVVKANLNPISKTLLPKIKSFALLHAEFQRVHMHIEKHVTNARNILDTRPSGAVFLELELYDEFVAALSKVRTIQGVQAFLDQQSVTPMFTKQIERPIDVPTEEVLPERPSSVINTKSRVYF